MKRKVFYFADERNDDFANTVKNIRPLPGNYRYVKKDPFSKFASFFLYRVLARPVAWLYMKMKFHHRFVGKKKLCRQKSGCFLYKNHVMLAGDAFVPNLITIRKRNYILTGKQTNSLRAIQPLMRALGNIPLGQDAAQSLAMLRCMRRHVGEGASITVYPEAHIWPYYTEIRPFPQASFGYAVALRVPVFCATTCFQKKRFGKTPRAITFIDGPFYPEAGMTREESIRYLRDKCYETMCSRAAEHSTYAVYEYRRKEGADGQQDVGVAS
jgi:1-acyl-sn-glycerol-3-phosphate acyltransferase